MRRAVVAAFLVASLALAGVGFVVWGQVTTSSDKQTAEQQRDHEQQQKRSLADEIADACAKGGQAAAELGAACVKAAEAKDSAVPVPVLPDPAELRDAARRALTEYCATRNECRGADGRSPDLEGIVTAVVARIPTPRDGTNGQNANAGQVASAVLEYCGQPSEPCRGRAGVDGKDGQSPPCLSEPNQCRGANGAPAAGWTWTDSAGRTQSCTRDAGSPDSAPTYTCTAAPPQTSARR